MPLRWLIIQFDVYFVYHKTTVFMHMFYYRLTLYKSILVCIIKSII